MSTAEDKCCVGACTNKTCDGADCCCNIMENKKVSCCGGCDGDSPCCAGGSDAKDDTCCDDCEDTCTKKDDCCTGPGCCNDGCCDQGCCAPGAYSFHLDLLQKILWTFICIKTFDRRHAAICKFLFDGCCNWLSVQHVHVCCPLPVIRGWQIDKMHVI